MSPTDDHTSISSDKSFDNSPANPFVAFRHFADNGLSSLFNLVLGSGFLDLPSDPRVRNPKPEYVSCLRESAQPKACPLRRIELRDKARLMEANAARNEILHQRQQALTGTTACSYMHAEAEHLSSQERNDLDTFLSSQRALAQHSDNTNDSDNVCPPHPAHSRPSIPLHYLFYDQYSPLHLEREDPSIAYRTGWRAAFEDLIYVQNGQGLSEYPDEASSSAEPPLDWIRNMIKLSFSKQRRSAEAYEACLERRRDRYDSSFDADRTLGLALSVAKASRPAVAKETLHGRPEYEAGGNLADDGDDHDKDKQPSTEADLYERLKDGEQFPRTNAKTRVLAHLQQDVSHDSTVDSSETSLLSTLTTTEKTTLSDGTVHTKMVLKKRFADGREESTESIHTQNAPPRTKAKRTELSDSTERQLQGGKEWKGWFWS